MQDAGAAAVRVSGLEVGGLFGSLLAGRISDWMVLRSGGKGGNVGKRVQVPRPMPSTPTQSAHAVHLRCRLCGVPCRCLPVSGDLVGSLVIACMQPKGFAVTRCSAGA